MRLAPNNFWIVVAALIVSTQIAAAQSGRTRKPEPTPTPSPATSGSLPTSPSSTSASSTATPADSGEKTTQPKFHPAAFIVTGRTIIHGGKSFWRSDDVKGVADDIRFMWDLERVPAKIVKTGKMTRTQAVARAKQETDSYVLYMEIYVTMTTAGLRTYEFVDHIDYVLLLPRTGEAARVFKVDPASIVQTNEHGTPLPPRTQGPSSNYYAQLQRCAWEMARVLRYWL